MFRVFREGAVVSVACFQAADEWPTAKVLYSMSEAPPSESCRIADLADRRDAPRRGPRADTDSPLGALADMGEHVVSIFLAPDHGARVGDTHGSPVLFG
jgi:hypothetical protein